MSTRRWGGRVKLIVGLALLVFLAGCSVAAPVGDDPGVSSTPEMDGGTEEGHSGPTGTDETTADDADGSDSDEQTTEGDSDEQTTEGDSDGQTTDGDSDEQTTDGEGGEDSEQQDGDTESEEQTDSGSAGPIDDAELPVDANRIYNQTAAVLETDVSPPSLTVKEINQTVGMTENPFFEFLGLVEDVESGEAGVGAAGYATGPDSIVINDAFASENLTSRQQQYLETTLAHEFVHTIQFEEGWLNPDWEEPPSVGRRTMEFRLLASALVEGGAVIATDGYARATGMSVRQSQQFQRAYREATPDAKLSYAPYNLGGQYFDSVLDNVSNLGEVYDGDPPRTTTEILHPERDDFEPTPVEFSADVTADNWTQRSDMTDTTGEMFLHIALSAHTDVGTAEEAAAGWANDRLFGFENGDDLSYAWAIHWESPAEADQFAAAFNRSVEAREDAKASQLDVRFAGNRTVVVVAGSQSFRDAVVLDGKNTTLEIVVTESALRSAWTVRDPAGATIGSPA